MKKNRKYIWCTIMILVILLCAVRQELWVSANCLVVNHYKCENHKLEKELKIVVLSDLHGYEFGEDNAELVKKVKEQEPELILLLGDFVNEDSENADVTCELIGELKDIAPVYFSLGNHELAYMEAGKPELLWQLEAVGAKVLDKEYVDLDFGETTIRLGGLYNYAFGFSQEEELSEERLEMKEYLEEFQATDSVKIMMSHLPDSFIFGDASSFWNIDLVVSGHNHGGQVVLPVFGGVFGGDQGYFPEYVHGMYQKDEMNIFVTSGLSTNQKPLPRFNNRPEIAVITIS